MGRECRRTNFVNRQSAVNYDRLDLYPEAAPFVPKRRCGFSFTGSKKVLIEDTAGNSGKAVVQEFETLLVNRTYKIYQYWTNTRGGLSAGKRR
jgi:hypothetical protein